MKRKCKHDRYYQSDEGWERSVFCCLDSEYWDSFNEQMAELGNNLRDSGIEVRQMSREEMEKMQKLSASH